MPILSDTSDPLFSVLKFPRFRCQFHLNFYLEDFVPTHKAYTGFSFKNKSEARGFKQN